MLHVICGMLFVGCCLGCAVCGVLFVVHLLKAEDIAVVDVVGGVLGVRVLGQPDLDVCQQVGIRAVKQHPVALRRPRVPETHSKS